MSNSNIKPHFNKPSLNKPTSNKSKLHQSDTLILNQVVQQLMEEGFSDIIPMRLSYTDVMKQNQQHKQYQGLVRAKYHGDYNSDTLVVKWQQLFHHSFRDSFHTSKLGNQSHEKNRGTVLDYSIMPFYPLGNVVKFLTKLKAVPNKYTVEDMMEIKKTLLRSIAKNISDLQNHRAEGNRCIHGDIKPSNILVTGFNKQKDRKQKNNRWNIEVVLIDFDMVGVTPAYLAPECWQGQGNTQNKTINKTGNKTMSSDCYAFGIMMYEILMEKRPFFLSQQQKELAKQQQLLCWEKQHRLSEIPKLSHHFIDYQTVLDYFLDKAPAQRIKGLAQFLGMA